MNERRYLSAKSKEVATQQGLWISARQGTLKRVKLLLDEGVDISRRDKEGRTALRLATDRGQTDVLDLLKAHRAKTD
ncbi:MAG: ankyrin repeat domain-containing protein [Desulfomonilaceae bacterium]